MFQSTKEKAKPNPQKVLSEEYKKAISTTLQQINTSSSQIFNIDESLPAEQQLRTYSRKYEEIYKRIKDAPGSSLVYSNYLTMEGLGIFSIALNTNGFEPIKLEGNDDDLKLSDETGKQEKHLPSDVFPRTRCAYVFP